MVKNKWTFHECLQKEILLLDLDILRIKGLSLLIIGILVLPKMYMTIKYLK